MTTEEATRLLESLPPNPRHLEMVRYYAEHGCYRPEDLRWVLGDPTVSVRVGPDGVEWDKGDG